MAEICKEYIRAYCPNIYTVPKFMPQKGINEQK